MDPASSVIALTSYEVEILRLARLLMGKSTTLARRLERALDENEQAPYVGIVLEWIE